MLIDASVFTPVLQDPGLAEVAGGDERGPEEAGAGVQGSLQGGDGAPQGQHRAPQTADRHRGRRRSGYTLTLTVVSHLNVGQKSPWANNPMLFLTGVDIRSHSVLTGVGNRPHPLN